jgi:ribosome maturation factor RimP
VDLIPILERAVAGLGYELVELENAGRGRLLRLFVDKPGGISIEDCVTISNHLSRVLVAENVDYGRLEVSSPGADRVLRRREDYERFAGNAARIQLRIPINGTKRLVGVIARVGNEELTLATERGDARVAFVDIEKARLAPDYRWRRP